MEVEPFMFIARGFTCRFCQRFPEFPLFIFIHIYTVPSYLVWVLSIYMYMYIILWGCEVYIIILFLCTRLQPITLPLILCMFPTCYSVYVPHLMVSTLLTPLLDTGRHFVPFHDFIHATLLSHAIPCVY